MRTEGLPVVVLGCRTVVINGSVTIVGDEVVHWAEEKLLVVKVDGAEVCTVRLDA